MPVCLIGLGSNQGNRQQALEAAVAGLAAEPAVTSIARSAWHETAPIGGPAGQEAFLNGALFLETTLGPHELLAKLQQIEIQLGRRRDARWGPRTIDLDLLLYDELVLSTPALALPHPRLAFRRFVLEPAAEVAGSMLYPTIGWSIARLLAHLDTSDRYVAVTGPIAAGKTRLARRLAAAMGGRLMAERPDWTRLGAFYADPAGLGLDTELEFLNERAQLLGTSSDVPLLGTSSAIGNFASKHCLCQAVAHYDGRIGSAGASPSHTGQWTVSDFWFDQSAAFARAWLSAERLPRFIEEYERLRPMVVQPRLIVLLDSPAEELLSRIHRRGRKCERRLTAEQLDGIRRAVIKQADQPDVGPVLHVANGDHETVFAEVLAAVQGME